MMDNDRLLLNVAVKGEISNYKLYPSGHHYFTLKDENAALKCVMFKGNAVKMRFRPENGMQVIAMGRISVYARDGAYQLYCTALNVDGVGDLHAAFEQMKAKLAAQGLFDEAHKKPIPRYPSVIGIITSSAGAAVHDMIRILRKRFPICKVRLIPVRVQGVEAPGEIASAIAYANAYKLADVLIVGRGGGSIEDLWAFNEEIVARAIYSSEIPIISAVGHEPDVTISDYVADVRASTPSNAAELVVPDQNTLMQTFDSIRESMTGILLQKIKSHRLHLSALSSSSVLRSPQAYIENRQNSLALLNNRLNSGYSAILNKHRQRFVMQTAKLDALSPLKVLTRGYSVAQSQDGTVIHSVSQINLGDNVIISVSDGKIQATVEDKEQAV
jgi:exodeoxyribonuclease VII large subunit